MGLKFEACSDGRMRKWGLVTWPCIGFK